MSFENSTEDLGSNRAIWDKDLNKSGPRGPQYGYTPMSEEGLNDARYSDRSSLDRVGKNFAEPSRRGEQSNVGARPEVVKPLQESKISESPSVTPDSQSQEKNNQELLVQKRAEFMKTLEQVQALSAEFALVDAEAISVDQAKRYGDVKNRLAEAEAKKKALGQEIMALVSKKTVN